MRVASWAGISLNMIKMENMNTVYKLQKYFQFLFLGQIAFLIQPYVHYAIRFK